MASAPVCALLLFGIYNRLAKISEIAIILRDRQNQATCQFAFPIPAPSRTEIEAEIMSRAESLAKEEVKKILALEKQNREATAAATQAPAFILKVTPPPPARPIVPATKPAVLRPPTLPKP